MIQAKDIANIAEQVEEIINEIEEILNRQFSNEDLDFVVVDPEFSVYSGIFSLFLGIKVRKGDDYPEVVDRFEISLKSLQKIQEKTNADDVWISQIGDEFLISLEFSLS